MEQRRMTDPNKIEEMIAAEADPKDRAFLLILNNINNSLVENTSTIKDVAARLEGHIEVFEKHTAREEAMINQGRGAWKVAAWVFGFLQIVALGAATVARVEIAEVHKAIHVDQVEHAKMGQRLDILERKP